MILETFLVTTPYFKAIALGYGTICDALTLDTGTGHFYTLMLMHATMRYKNVHNARCKPMDSGARPRGGRPPARARLRPGSGLPAPAPALRGHVRAASWPHYDLPAQQDNDTDKVVRGEVASARGCAGEAEAGSGHMAGHGQCGGRLCARCIKS